MASCPCNPGPGSHRRLDGVPRRTRQLQGHREALGLPRNCGEWGDSEEDFARHIVDECYNLEKEMSGLVRYFYYEAFGRELFMYDYSMGANNNVFRNI